MGGTTALVDIHAVRLITDDVGLGTQSTKYRAGNTPGSTVGTIQTDFQSLIGVGSQGNKIAGVAVSACGILMNTTKLRPLGKRQILTGDTKLV